MLRRSLGLGGALSLGAAVHLFVGMIEAPLLIRPWLARMERGEIFALMSFGIAGTVMLIFGAMLRPVIPDALGSILSATIILTPATLAIAAIMIPFGDPGPDESRLTLPDPPRGALDAIVRGMADGMAPLV